MYSIDVLPISLQVRETTMEMGTMTWLFRQRQHSAASAGRTHIVWGPLDSGVVDLVD